MVVEYLENIENHLMEQLRECSDLQSELDLQLKESQRFIALLEESDDPYYEAFSPRKVNLYQKRKLRDLHEEQEEIIHAIETQAQLHESLDRDIAEIRQVLKEARLLSKNSK